MPTATYPDPPVPADCDVTIFSNMPLDVTRLLQSDLYARSTPEEFKAALTLWARAWHQVPAGSLPSDERILSYLSGAGRRWNRVREMALRGFELCSDGRYYHRFLCEKASLSFSKRKTQSRRARIGVENKKRGQPSENAQSDMSRGRAVAGAVAEHGHSRGSAVAQPIEGKGIEGNHNTQDSPKTPATAVAKADVLAVKKKICSAFEANGRLLPSLGQIDVWIAQGFSLDLIEAVVVSGLQARPNVSNLKYFDQALTDAATPRSPSPPSSSKLNGSLSTPKVYASADADGRCVKVGGPRGSIPWTEMRNHVAKWLDDGYWPVNLWEYPGKPSSPVTPAMLETMKSELTGAPSQ